MEQDLAHPVDAYNSSVAFVDLAIWRQQPCSKQDTGNNAKNDDRDIVTSEVDRLREDIRMLHRGLGFLD